MRTQIFCSALTVLLLSSATGCSSSSSWLARWNWWGSKSDMPTKETALASAATPQLPSQTAGGYPPGVTAPPTGYPTTPSVNYGAPGMPAGVASAPQQASYLAPQSGPYNPAAYGQAAAAPATGYPSTGQSASYSYPSTTPSQQGATAQGANSVAMNPTGMADRYGQAEAAPTAGYPQTDVVAGSQTPSADNYQTGSPYDAPSAGNRYTQALQQASNATATAAQTIEQLDAAGQKLAQDAAALTAGLQAQSRYPSTGAAAAPVYPQTTPAQTAPATTSTPYPTTSAPNAVPAAGGFRPAGTSDYTPPANQGGVVPAAANHSYGTPATTGAVVPATTVPQAGYAPYGASGS